MTKAPAKVSGQKQGPFVEESERMGKDEYGNIVTRLRFPKRHKYGARRATAADGTQFPSKAERDRYEELVLLQMAGAISELTCQPRFVLQETFKSRGKTIRSISYVADFSYREPANSCLVVEDTKGMRTPVFRLKEKLFLKRYPNIDFRVLRV